MPTIVLDGTGVSKATLVEGAYDFCGLNDSEYERTPEEMIVGLKRLNALMALLLKKGIDLGFDFPTYAHGLLEEPSGIPDDAVEPVCAMLAQRLAPGLGAELSSDARAVLSKAMQDLSADYALAPPSIQSPYHLRTAASRHQNRTRITISTDYDPGDLAGLVGG